jgi:hypothetical protein
LTAEPRGNPRREYRVVEAVYLADADERRYVMIEPVDDELRVSHGRFDTPSGMTAMAPVETYAVAEIAGAVQRVCQLAGDWLEFAEWEIEQARDLFVARS